MYPYFRSAQSICIILWTVLVWSWIIPLHHSFDLTHRRSQYATARNAHSSTGWFPVLEVEQDDDIYRADNDAQEILEAQSAILAAGLARARLNSIETPSTINTNFTREMEPFVRGRFMDLTCTAAGETSLENLFFDQSALIQRAVEEASTWDVVRGAVLTFQSLCAMATQVGLRGPPEQLRRMVAHLDDRNDKTLIERDFRHTWDRDSVRRLKYRVDRSPALDLLAELMWKRTPQGAFDLLIKLGVWTEHEDLALLRSGFPLRFTDEEEELAKQAVQDDRDPDAMLGIRKDLRHLKVYTIDGASTTEIDDGLSLETVTKSDGTTRNRVWIHIADADRWAPRGSKLLEIARQRITSLYLPLEAIFMFPSSVSSDLMALKTSRDSHALSLAVELNEDGSVDPDSLMLTPSIIRVTYRLTYDEVDEMLEEGIGYREEWELGALLAEAKKRRKYRCANGSSEQLIPRPIPTASVSVNRNNTRPEEVDISLSIQVAYNSGQNQSKATLENPNSPPSFEDPVSSSYLLVTEAMIMSGECLGHWKTKMEQEYKQNSGNEHDNTLRLAFRAQPKPEFLQRLREYKTFLDLLEQNVGDGYCHAWYGRRFLQGAKVSESRLPHAGLGLSSYVQWSSPIRRFSDLQVHSCIKRYLRRNRVYKLWKAGERLPDGLTPFDLGLPQGFADENGRLTPPTAPIKTEMLDNDIDFMEGGGLLGAARNLQKRSQEYWHFEYIRRTHVADPGKIYDAVILGLIDPAKRQHAIYVYELGLEHRYTSPAGILDAGVKLRLLVDDVSPRHGLLSFVRTM